MKTSAIVHRVADFLKGFPPFCYLDQPVLESVAASGRVRFHESEEILFSTNDGYDAQLQVIQQGSVRLTLPGPGKNQDQVVDLLGPGDMLGLGRFIGRTTHEHGATTVCDTVIYALDFKTFCQACSESPQATRFLQVHFAAEPEAVGVPETMNPATPPLTVPFVSCADKLEMREAALLMSQAQIDELLVVDAYGMAVGCLTAAVFVNYCAATGPGVTDIVRDWMLPPPPAVSSKLSSGGCIGQMIRSRRRQLCVTLDGTSESAASGLITERDLLLWTGNNPTVAISGMLQSHSVDRLDKIRRRINRLLESDLNVFQDLDRNAALITEVNRVLLRRLTLLAAAAATTSIGHGAPCDFCLAFAGEAARGELLTQDGLELVLILDREADENHAWFSAWAENLEKYLETCGFSKPGSGYSPANRECRLTLDRWSENFRRWIASPIENNILQRLPLFDLEPVEAGNFLCQMLRQNIQKSLEQHPNFIRLLANDCFENLPPMTIFDGFAVNADSLQKEELKLRTHALQPVVDVARVLQLATGEIEVTSTLERLESASRRRRDGRRIFEQAARAFRIAMTCEFVSGSKSTADGGRTVSRPISRQDQLLLKSGFQSIAALLEYAAQLYGFRR